MESTTSSARLPRPVIWLILAAVIGIAIWTTLPALNPTWLLERIPVFGTIFLGIFIEAVPFLMLGTISSGLVEVFIDQERLNRFVSRNPLQGALAGAVMGLFFPVCECGVVPLARRLFRKGLPIPAGVAFLLAAPVINPIVILSTAAAFGWGQVLFWRVGLTLLIAVATGLIFSVERVPWTLLRPTAWITVSDVEPHEHEDINASSLIDRLRQAVLIAGNEFFEMGRYLVAGAILAAAMQALVPQSMLLGVGRGPLSSVLVMLSLAVILSICSTVDAFVALGFAGSFSLGSVLAFLVFGPMVDIKSTLMFLRVFRPRPVVYLILLPLMMSLLAGLAINYYLP